MNTDTIEARIRRKAAAATHKDIAEFILSVHKALRILIGCSDSPHYRQSALDALEVLSGRTGTGIGKLSRRVMDALLADRDPKTREFGWPEELFLAREEELRDNVIAGCLGDKFKLGVSDWDGVTYFTPVEDREGGK